MGNVSALWKVATSWYVSLLFVVAAGIAIGYFVFFDVYPGKPKIGIIDIPFSVITDDSAFVFTAYLDFARQNDDIKAVVIKLNSPGSFGAAGEQMYRETRKLRETKPVVIAMGDVAASGAYEWALGANYTYAKSSSFVGSVGVFLNFRRPIPSIPAVPDESVIRTGPSKFLGTSVRDLFGVIDQAGENFYQQVLAERGDKLRLSREEILEARIYNGNEAVRLGLVDAVGGDTEAIEKAASLAGISNYGLVDVNTEVSRIFIQKFVHIFGPLLGPPGGDPGMADINTLLALSGGKGTGDTSPVLGGITSINMLRRFFLPSEVGELPPELDIPRINHLYGELSP